MGEGTVGRQPHGCYLRVLAVGKRVLLQHLEPLQASIPSISLGAQMGHE